MAQLPPKIPSAPQNHWPPFASPHQRMPPVGSFAPAGGGFGSAQSSWADEFVEFASARRGAHRRSASDTIAFLDDEQLMSMFSDDVGAPPTGSNSSDSIPSDQNSNNDDQKAPPPLDQPKSEPGEVESTCIPDPQAAGHSTGGASAMDAIVDPKRIKRILANRQSAQRSRVRKLQYISELERSVTTLQSEVSALSPRVAFLDHQRLILNVDNSALKQRIAALAQDKIFKDAHQVALKKEIERLRQLYQQQQNMKKINGGGAAANNRHAPPLSGQNVQQQQEHKFLNAPDQAMTCTEN